MLQINSATRIAIAIQAVDFRCGIDTLANKCLKQLGMDPFSGRLYVFRNRSGTSIKMLIYDGNGFWLCQKRFSKGKLKWWPSDKSDTAKVNASELLICLQQGTPTKAGFPDDWRRVIAD
jgi:transposase